MNDWDLRNEWGEPVGNIDPFGEWVCITSSSLRTLPDGRIGRHHVLAHPTIDCIALLNGDGALWVRKQTQECEHLDYSDTMNGAVCNDCGAEEGGEEE